MSLFFPSIILKGAGSRGAEEAEGQRRDRQQFQPPATGSTSHSLHPTPHTLFTNDQ
ncbi:hypothetical protein [Chroococcidiopsis sp.]|uniref:hypothetical protein n=1 Tax=Chroococcidiopsis sp. TaxID=3088168 RepID=UPI003F3C140F